MAAKEVLEFSIIGNLIAQRRAALDITGADLARFSGLAEKTINKIEHGWIPKLPTALAIAAALDCRVEDVFVVKLKTRPGRRRKQRKPTT